MLLCFFIEFCDILKLPGYSKCNNVPLLSIDVEGVPALRCCRRQVYYHYSTTLLKGILSSIFRNNIPSIATQHISCCDDDW